MLKPQVQELVAILLGAFPSARVTEHTPAVYASGLRDLDFALAEAAIRRLLLTARFMPTIAEIREAALETMHGDQRSGAEAWGDVLRAVGRFGRDQQERATAWLAERDPLLPEAVAAVGWRVICNCEETDSAPRAKFADAYNRLAKGARKSAALSAGVANPKLAKRDNASMSTADLMKRLTEGGDTQ